MARSDFRDPARNIPHKPGVSYPDDSTSYPTIVESRTAAQAAALKTMLSVHPDTTKYPLAYLVHQFRDPGDNSDTNFRCVYMTLPGPWVITERRLVTAGASNALSTYFERKTRHVLPSTYPSYATTGTADSVSQQSVTLAEETIEGFVDGSGISVSAKIYIDRVIDSETDVVLSSYHQIVAGDTAESALRALYDSDAAFGTSTIYAYNTIASVAVLLAGNDYTTLPTLAIGAPLVPGGTQATATARMAAYSATKTAGGTGYVVGDLLTVSGGTSTTTARFTVATVSAGAILTVTLERAGSYSALPTNAVSVTGGTGTGATLTILWGILSVTIGNAGTGYRVTPTVIPSAGSANLRATLGSLTSYTVDCYVIGASLEDIEGSARKLLKWQTSPIPAPRVTHVDEPFSVPGSLIQILSNVTSPNGRPWPGTHFTYYPPQKLGHAARETLTFKFGSNFSDLPQPFCVVQAPAAISSFFPISPNTAHSAITWNKWDSDGVIEYRETFGVSTSVGQSNPYCISSTQKFWRGRMRVKRVIENDPAGILY